MRQRLGIAAALLGDPSVLVLDEPANGLDPEGIRWMRGLLRDFAAAGGTVLVSSHLLREVEATVDRLVVIDDGRVVAQGTLAELRRRAPVGLPPSSAVSTPPACGPACSRPGSRRSAPRTAARCSSPPPPEQVGRAAQAAGQVLLELRTADGGLEELFFRLTSHEGSPTTSVRRPRRPSGIP